MIIIYILASIPISLFLIFALCMKYREKIMKELAHQLNLSYSKKEKILGPRRATRYNIISGEYKGKKIKIFDEYVHSPYFFTLWIINIILVFIPFVNDILPNEFLRNQKNSVIELDEIEGYERVLKLKFFSTKNIIDALDKIFNKAKI